MTTMLADDRLYRDRDNSTLDNLFALSDDPKDYKVVKVQVNGSTREVTVRRIIAKGDFELDRRFAAYGYTEVKNGDKGGYVETVYNLSQYHSRWRSWVADDAIVLGSARVSQHGLVCGHAVVHDARVFGKALVGGTATVEPGARVSGASDVLGDSVILGGARVLGPVKITKKHGVWVFRDFWRTGETYTYLREPDRWVIGNDLLTGDEVLDRAKSAGDLDRQCCTKMIDAAKYIYKTWFDKLDKED